MAYVKITNNTASSSTSTGALVITGGLGVSGNIRGQYVYGAVWNDLTDFIPVDQECILEYGKCYCFDGQHYYQADRYCPENIIGIHSDTAGFGMGHKEDIEGIKELECSIAGFVLAYVDKEYPVGTPLTATENGYLTAMAQEDKREFPERIVATFWKPESAETWGSKDKQVQVNGRMWVKIK